MKKVPIPEASERDKNRLAGLARRAGKEASEGRSADLKKTDREIDTIVSKLFGLTNDELRIIESTGDSRELSDDE